MYSKIILLAALTFTYGDCGGFGRIIGGDEATPHSFPHQVSISFNGNHLCAGSVLNSRYILTSAQCIIGEPSTCTVLAGAHNLFTDEQDSWQVSEVKAIKTHPGFDPQTWVNDIAMFELTTPLVMNQYVQPIALPIPMHSASGVLKLSGWGTTTEGTDEISPVLRQVDIPIVSDDDCKTAYTGVNEVTASMICLGDLQNGGKDACLGDSGAPAIANDTGSWYLAGISSWGVGCGRPGFPGVSTEVSHFIDWIIENAK